MTKITGFLIEPDISNGISDYINKTDTERSKKLEKLQEENANKIYTEVTTICPNADKNKCHTYAIGKCKDGLLCYREEYEKKFNLKR